MPEHCTTKLFSHYLAHCINFPSRKRSRNLLSSMKRFPINFYCFSIIFLFTLLIFYGIYLSSIDILSSFMIGQAFCKKKSIGYDVTSQNGYLYLLSLLSLLSFCLSVSSVFSVFSVFSVSSVSYVSSISSVSSVSSVISVSSVPSFTSVFSCFSCLFCFFFFFCYFCLFCFFLYFLYNAPIENMKIL